jgi:hypothetical protein
LKIDRQQLIGSLADLGTDRLQRNVFAKLRERSLPRSGMEIDRVDNRPINIENHSFDRKLFVANSHSCLTAVVLYGVMSVYVCANNMPGPRIKAFSILTV